jgi:hypothetical protein
MKQQKVLILLVVILSLISISAFSHNLQGIITDKDGNPIPYATVYIKNISLGTTTNDVGKFELDIKPGTYEVNFRCLGYQPKSDTIKVTKEVENVKVVMEVQILQIQEVTVTGGGEDPAYPVMRKVIGLSYVHLNQISSYSANFYIRGTVKFEKVPGLIRNQLRKKNIDIKSGDVLVNETVNRIDFQAPNKYEQHIQSINSTFPEVVDFSVEDFLGASLYQDNIQILNTPLCKNAFSYYNFKYEGFDYDKKYTVDKIKVTPKIKSKQLFEGYIYIIEDLWCLHRADLKFDTPFGEVSFQLVYDEVYPGVWLPVGHNYTFNGGLLGVRGNARFAASIKYDKIKINQQVLAMANLPVKANNEIKEEKNKVEAPTQAIKPSVKQRESKISQLLEKPKLNNQEMSKLSRLMSKEDQAKKPDSLKTLEINDAVKVVVDKGANKKDTGYWAALRPIPLSSDEIASFRQRDSIALIKKKYATNDSVSLITHKKNYGIFNPLFFGVRFYMKDSTWRIRYDGLITTKRINFNPVDGFNISQNISFTKYYKPGYSLSLVPYLAYAINREALLGTGTALYSYSPMHRGSFQLSGGRNTIDFNGEADGINPFINSISSLFFKENYARYYESRFFKLFNTIDIANGLTLRTNVKWESVKRLENSTTFSIFDKDDQYSQNLPVNREVSESALKDQINAIAGIKIEFTPRYFYRVRDGVKIMSRSNYPTFYISYEKGIKNIFSSTSDYDFLGAGMSYAKELSSTSSIAYEFHTGWFPNNSQIHFSDFAHAPTQTSPVLLKEYRHAFFLPGYYELSTSDNFVRAHLSYKSPYILLKYLPFLSNTLWREMIWSSYFNSPQNRNYVEVGYTLLEVLLSANVGVFAGFADGKFNGIGLNVAFRLTD